MRVAEDNIPKTAFHTPKGFFEWVVMLFGLTNASSYFVDLISRVFWEQLNKFVVSFVDDILIHSRSEREHIRHLKIILDVLRKNQLRANFLKCHF